MRPKSDEIRNKILLSAKEEFLEKGFRDASLRNISKSIDVTTGAIYTYFKNKDEMLEVLVSPIITKVKRKLDSKELNYEQVKISEQELKNWFSRYIRFLLDLVEQHHDEMKLLFICSEGSKYVNYKDELINIGKERGKTDFRSLKRTPEFEGQEISGVFIHNLVNFVFNIIIEILKNDFRKQDIEQFEKEITAFLFSGWKGLVQV